MAKNRYVNTHFWDDRYIRKLSPMDKLLFLYLITNPLANLAGIYEITLDRMAFDTGLKTDRVEKALKGFERDGKAFLFSECDFVVVKNTIKNQKLNDNMKKGIESLIPSWPQPVISFLERQIDKPLKAFESLWNALNNINSNLNLNLNSNLNSNPVQESIKEPDVLLESSFDVFWKAYPRKKNKGHAEITWSKIKPSKELQRKILSAIEKQKNAKMIARGDEFTPHPSTWLNAKAWENEVIILESGSIKPNWAKCKGGCGFRINLNTLPSGYCKPCEEKQIASGSMGAGIKELAKKMDEK